MNTKEGRTGGAGGRILAIARGCVVEPCVRALGAVAQAMRDYSEVRARIRAVCEGEDDAVALMATVACELYHSFGDFDWVGFYRVTAPGVLKIGPYQGGHGCLVIPFERGVCGAAAREMRTQVVRDVDEFPGHIACAASTRSEIVVPVTDGAGALVGVLDVDSDRPAAFDEADATALEAIVREIFAAGGVDRRGASVTLAAWRA
jgi:L-methionine (R)-S-oxide reductase